MAAIASMGQAIWKAVIAQWVAAGIGSGPGFTRVALPESNDQNLWMSLGGAREKWAHLPEDDLKVQ
ncbi:hypothetical protein [Mycobacterium avium]|uniref:hypothetical protein n=1 Tax=Mycobacterium avium TaxID=1764 RepID=UPI001E5C0284|nr:hypothetical protein [Mycobacterium avium]